jgi:hypothetical protein
VQFDPAKDRINRRKHGISLAAAAEIDVDKALVIEDRRVDYGEARFLAYAPIAGRCMSCGSRCAATSCGRSG